MDFTEDFEFNSPCLIVQSSQLENSQSRSDSDLLKNLDISRSLELSAKLTSKLNRRDGGWFASSSDSVNTKERRTRLKEYSAKKAYDGSGKNQKKSEQGGNNNDSSGQLVHGQAQACPVLGAGGGMGGAGGDDNDEGNNDDSHEPSTCDDDTSHHEPATSSSDSLPELIPQHHAQVPVQADTLNTSASCSSGTEDVQGQSISQTSTAIVEDDVAPSVLLTKKSSSSSSSGGYRSDLTSSSAYNASLSSNPSSLSSESLHAISSQSPPYSLPLGMRTQTESDALSTSIGNESRGDVRTPLYFKGFPNVKTVEESADNQDHSACDSIKDQNEVECSSQEDLFGFNKESNAISSQEVSRLCTPQDRSTPVEQKASQNKASDAPLFKQVLSIQTSTPVELPPSVQQTLSSQNITPSQSFHCFHFSGEEMHVKESSESSSSGVIKSSPDVLMMVPSSPTSTTRFEQPSSKSSQDASSRSSQSSSSLEVQSTASKSNIQKQCSETSSSQEHFPSSPNSFCYPWRQTSLAPSPEEEIKAPEEQVQEQCSKGNKQNSDNDEFTGLPRWQQELIQKNKKEQSVSSSSSLRTSSSSNSYENMQHPEQPGEQSWQSEVITTSEGNNSLHLSKKHEVKHVHFKIDATDSASERMEAKTEITSVENEPDINLSLSPCSIDRQVLTVAATSDSKAISDLVLSRVSCTQPELSQDPFHPSSFSTQEDNSKNLQYDSKSKGIQIYEDNEPDSQESSKFDLHISQSQSEMDSPPLIPEPLSPLAIPMTVSNTVACDEDVLPSPLKKQDFESNPSPEPLSLLIPTTISSSLNVKDSVTNSDPESPTTSTPSTVVISDNVCLSVSSLLKKQDSDTPSQSILKPVVKEKQKGHSSLQQHDIRGTGAIKNDIQNVLVSNTTPKTLPLHKKNENEAIALSSEASCDSITGMGFHFSLPTNAEPLQPVTCTTPPPLQARQVPAAVCETPGIFTQESNTITTSGTTIQKTSPLTFSMPRENESEAETYFHMQGMQSTSSSSTTDPLEASRTMEQSVFAQVRDETHSSRRHENQDEYNPFEFTSQDDIPTEPPISRRKSRKRERVQPFPGNSNSKTDLGSHSNIDEGIRILQDRQSDSLGSSVDSGNNSSNVYHKVTEVRTITTLTTKVEKVVTITITKKDSEEIVDKIFYVEDEKTNTDRTEDVNTEEIDFLQREDSTYEIVASFPTQQPVQSVRKSPRGKKRGRESNEESKNENSKRQRTAHSDSASKVDSLTLDRTELKSRSQKKSMIKDDDSSTSLPLLRRESTEKITEQIASRTVPEPTLNLTTGTRVFAHWWDNHFYSGVISSGPSKLGYYTVRFDDGNKRNVRAERLICKVSLRVGQNVLGQDLDGYYDPGVIVGHYRNGDETGYEIKDMKGIVKRYPAKNVILTEEQAATILSSSASSISILSGTSGSSENADGIHTRSRSLNSPHGSMSRSSSSTNVSSGGLNSRCSSSTNVSTGGLDSRSRETSAKDTSSSSNDLTRRDSFSTSPFTANSTDETPKSSRKKLSRKLMKKGKQLPQPWRGMRGIESSSEASSDEGERRACGKLGARRGLEKILSQPRRTSPRKQKQTKEKARDDQNDRSNILGPLPSDDSLFAGFGFLLTGCHNVKDTDAKSDSPDSESEFVRFDRQYLVQQIEAGGGVVLKDFEETQTSGADKCFLISSSHQRTKKFFQCLAYSIPIVHHSWINDSSTLNKLLDYKKYLLPAGTSLETGDVMEVQPETRVLQGLKIYLHGDASFKATWSSVVLAAGCSVITKLPNRPGRAVQFDDTTCDVIISGNNTLPASISHAVEVLGIPVVALEWLLQCLINGFLVPIDGHPKYDFRNIQKDDNANL